MGTNSRQGRLTFLSIKDHLCPTTALLPLDF